LKKEKGLYSKSGHFGGVGSIPSTPTKTNNEFNS